jgi:hypothetical protein
VHAGLRGGTQSACVRSNFFSKGLVNAVSYCGHDNSLVLFDSTGVYTPPTTDPLVQLNTGTYSTANWEIDSYQVGIGTGTPRTAYAFVCYPTAAGKHPVQIYNHPGDEGLFGNLRRPVEINDSEVAFLPVVLASRNPTTER